jgi:hypothetical protein
MEGRQAKALGYRRPARHQEDEAGDHQRAESGDEGAVDGQPPLVHVGAFRARRHAHPPPVGSSRRFISTPGSARTKSRK